MNIDHLRKQAKTLTKLYPALAAAHAGSLPLSAAQRLIAQVNGYPTWEALIGSEATTGPVVPPRVEDAPDRVTTLKRVTALRNELRAVLRSTTDSISHDEPPILMRSRRLADWVNALSEVEYALVRQHRHFALRLDDFRLHVQFLEWWQLDKDHPTDRLRSIVASQGQPMKSRAELIGEFRTNDHAAMRRFAREKRVSANTPR